MDEILPERVSLCDVEAGADGDLSAERIEELHDFYVAETERQHLKGLKFKRLAVLEIVRGMGYFRYDAHSRDSIMVRAVDNILERVTDRDIFDSIDDYIKALPPRTLYLGEENPAAVTIGSRLIMEKWYGAMANYSTLFERLRPEGEVRLFEDTEREKFFFFENCIVRVTPAGSEMLPYGRNDLYIWRDQILERRFERCATKGIFERFVENVTGHSKERKAAIMSYIGYLMHSYFGVDRKMILFTDTNEAADSRKNGGTGKSLLGTAISHMMNRRKGDTTCVEIGGKTFDAYNEKKYMNCDINTKLIFINDVRERFKFEPLYNDITDAVLVRKMHQTGFYIDAKIMMATNSTIRFDGNSDRRRVVFCELDNYYTPQFTPIKEFGKRFFDSTQFDTRDWLEFDNFMVRCEEVYMRDGLHEQIDVNYTNRAIIEHTNEDFVIWFHSKMQSYRAGVEQTVDKKKVWQQFCERYPVYKEDIKQPKMTKYIRYYFESKRIPFVELRSTNDIFVIWPTEETKTNASKETNLLD